METTDKHEFAPDLPPTPRGQGVQQTRRAVIPRLQGFCLSRARARAGIRGGAWRPSASSATRPRRRCRCRGSRAPEAQAASRSGRGGIRPETPAPHARSSRIVLYAPQVCAHSSRGERTSKRRHHALRRAVEGVGADDVVGHVDELRPVAHEDALPAPRRHKLGERLHALRVERRVDLVEDAKGRGG